jgi:hypothetical protein
MRIRIRKTALHKYKRFFSLKKVESPAFFAGGEGGEEMSETGSSKTT